MSVWALGLGAGLTYALMKQQTIYGSIQRAKVLHEERNAQEADSTVSVGELNKVKALNRPKAADTPGTEHLTQSERGKLQAAGKALENEAVSYDSAAQENSGVIEGVYMQHAVPQF